MKIKNLIIALSMGVVVASCSGNGAKLAKDYATPAEIDTVSYLLGINFGSFMKSYDFGNEINFAEVVKGMKDFINSEGSVNDPDFTSQFKINPEEIDRVFGVYLEKKSSYLSEKAKAEGAAFLEKNKNNAGVQVTSSGLQYIVVKEGNGVVPEASDKVKVHYKGTLVDGTVFDECPEEEDPITIDLSMVIPGWSEGLHYVGEGGKIKLFIPSELGYGENGAGAIAPNSVLIFDVDLVEVIKAEAAEEEAE